MVARSRSHLSLAFGGLNAVSALVLVVGVFGVVPTRHWVLDTLAAAIAALQLASAVGLLSRRPWARRALAISAWVCFGLGLLTVSLVVLTMVFLRSVHGEYGLVALAASGLIVALLVPYVLVLPTAQLLWLKSQGGEPEA